jgi:cell division septation protein DedD
MKSSVLIPVALVVCLLLLALIITKIFGVGDGDGVLTEITVPAAMETPLTTPENKGTLPTPETRFESDETPRELRPATVPDAESPPNAGAEGRYLVLAGTFRQLINARTRVRDLKQAGFERTTLEYFDRGTFAVALAGRYTDYGDAADLVRDLRQAGYEAQIMENR